MSEVVDPIQILAARPLMFILVGCNAIIHIEDSFLKCNRAVAATKSYFPAPIARYVNQMADTIWTRTTNSQIDVNKPVCGSRL